MSVVFEIEDPSMITQTSAALPVARPRASELAQALLALALGLFVVGVVGFSHLDILHNAAHDVRHSFAFPCH
jgi:cobalt transporter subunit CbtB